MRASLFARSTWIDGAAATNRMWNRRSSIESPASRETRVLRLGLALEGPKLAQDDRILHIADFKVRMLVFQRRDFE